MKKRRGSKTKPASANRTDQSFGNAVSLQQEGEYEAAIALYKKILRTVPEHEGALMNLGALSFAEGRNRESVAFFDKLLEINPKNSDAHYNRGKALIAMDRSIDAELNLNTALKLNPKDVMTIREYCNCCLLNEKPEAVLDCLEELEGPLRLEQSLLTAQANALLKVGQFEKAKDCLSEIVRSCPDCTEAYVLLSKVHFCSRDFDSALTAMKRAAFSNPGKAEYQRELGIIYSIQGERDAAKLAFLEAQRLDPELIMVLEESSELQDSDVMRHWDDLSLQMYLMERMRYWASRSQWRGAVNELLILSRKYVGRPSILQELAAAYQLNDEPIRARKFYLQLLQQEPENLEAKLQVCAIELDLENEEEALKLSGDMVRAFPEVVDVLILRGKALSMAGRAEEAEEVLSKAVQLAPGSNEANSALGRVLLSLQRYCEAVDVLESSVRSGGTTVGLDSLSILSSACRKSGDRARLRRILEDAVSRMPGSLTATVELARIFLECNMAEEAREYYRQATTFEATSLNEAVFLAESHIFCRSVDVAVRLVKNLKRKGRKGKDVLLFDALLQLMNGKRSRDSIAWQRLWSEAPEVPFQRVELIRSVLTPKEQESLVEDLSALKRLFAASSSTLSQMASLADSLEGRPNLEVISSNDDQK